MATGTAGSSFTSELNRLANGGTYPAITAYKAPTDAANDYAGTTGLALIGALNKAAGNAKGKQFVKQPKSIAKKTARYR